MSMCSFIITVMVFTNLFVLTIALIRYTKAVNFRPMYRLKRITLKSALILLTILILCIAATVFLRMLYWQGQWMLIQK